MIKKYNFELVNCDTDSISICNYDQSKITKETQILMLEEINKLLPGKVILDHDGYFPKFLVIRSKNYVMVKEDGKIKYKGSSILDKKRELSTRNLMNEIISSILENDINYDLINAIYEKYIIEANNVTDINQWAVKRTYTKAIMTSERTNESKVRDALKDETMSEGDRFYIYTSKGNTVKLTKHWVKGDEDCEKLTKRVFDTLNIFKEILDMSKFTKYHLKTKRKELEKLLNENATIL